MTIFQFSVLLSVYRNEHPEYFNSSLESLDKQTHKADEIVIVLDGPITDELNIIIIKWSQILPIKIVKIDNNVGLGKALNEGLKNCSHNWVFRMDTDDIATPDRFYKQVEYIKKNPNTVLVGGQVIEFNKNTDDLIAAKFVPTNLDEIKLFAKKRCPFNHMTVAYRKDIIQSLGGYRHHLYMEDYNLWLRVISNNHIVANLEDIILYARVGNGMYGRRKGLQYIKSEKELMTLKKALKIQTPLSAYSTFIFRSITRLLPATMLAKIYNKFLRKSI